MKKLKAILCSGAMLLALTGLSSCNKPEDDPTNPFVTKTTNIYCLNLENYSSPIGSVSLGFFNGVSSVPYFEFHDAMELLEAILGREKQSTIEYKNDILKYTWQFPNEKLPTPKEGAKSTITFDFKNNKIITHNIVGLAKDDAASHPLDVLSLSRYQPTSTSNVWYLRTANEFSVSSTDGSDYTIDLSKYPHVHIYQANGKPYIPVQLINDLFFASTHYLLLYNGTALYLASSDAIASDGYLTPAGKFYRNNTKTSRPDSDLANFSYDELCLNFDTFYGLRKYKGIDSFDTYFQEKGLKTKLLNGHESEALAELLLTDLDEGHSSFLIENPYEEFGSIKLQEYVGERNKTIGIQLFVSTSLRAIAYQEGIKTIEILPKENNANKTLFLTFDQFLFDPSALTGTKSYYSLSEDELFEKARYGDTLALMRIMLDLVKNPSNNIKNVVLDLSNNLGGMVDAAAFVAYACLGPQASRLALTCPTDDEAVCFTYDADCNFDHKIDQNDYLPSDIKLYCLTGGASFSCGNMIPAIFKDSGRAKILGQKSGGGSCVVLPGSTALGGIYNTSGPIQISNYINGEYINVDGGIGPDEEFEYSKLYGDKGGPHRQAILDYINSPGEI